MGFWIFMLIMVLLIPITMIAFGRLFLNSAPHNINSTFGYRTKRSMMNEDTWKFAHSYIGKLWFILRIDPFASLCCSNVFCIWKRSRYGRDDWRNSCIYSDVSYDWNDYSNRKSTKEKL